MFQLSTLFNSDVLIVSGFIVTKTKYSFLFTAFCSSLKGATDPVQGLICSLASRSKKTTNYDFRTTTSTSTNWPHIFLKARWKPYVFSWNGNDNTKPSKVIYLFKLVPVSFMKINFKTDQFISSVYRTLT